MSFTQTLFIMKNLTSADIIPALERIGYDLSDVPNYRVSPGRIMISIDDEDAEETLRELRANLPYGACAEWTGSSDTDGDGRTTSDCAITWRE